MPAHQISSGIALVLATVLLAAVGGCADTTEKLGEVNSGSFTRSFDVFAKPDWAKPNDTRIADLSPSGPVGPDDLVSADGRCVATQAAAPPPPAAAPAPADRPVGSMAGDLAGAPMPAGASAPVAPPEAGQPLVAGGIALNMTECDAVRRAGQPSNVSIGAGDKGGRKVVLTYLGGPWPGIYSFNDGRLKEITAAPLPPAPPKAAPKKKTKKIAKPKTPGTVQVQ